MIKDRKSLENSEDEYLAPYAIHSKDTQGAKIPGR